MTCTPSCGLTTLFWLQHWLEDDDLDKVMKNYDENGDGGPLFGLTCFLGMGAGCYKLCRACVHHRDCSTRRSMSVHSLATYHAVTVSGLMGHHHVSVTSGCLQLPM